MPEEMNPIREKNLQRLSRFLFEQGSAIKPKMAEETGISTVTVNSLVKDLVKQSIFIEGELIQQRFGRPAVEYHFNYDLAHYLLIIIEEVNGTTLLTHKIVNLNKQESRYGSLALDKLTKADLLEKLKEVIHSAKVPITSIGISIPGKIFQGTLISSWKEELNGWNIVEDLAKLTDSPIHVQNDAHLFTLGYSLNQDIMEGNTIVGIYYPPHSMPGVTILSDGQLIEGEKSLAGEAKFLPFLMDLKLPVSEETFLKNLVNLVSIYNVVIAPKYFVIFAGEASLPKLSQTLTQSETLLQQPNKPHFNFDDQVADSIETGLFWLVSQEINF